MRNLFQLDADQFHYYSQVPVNEFIKIFNSGHYSRLILSDDYKNSKFINNISFIEHLDNLKVLSINTHYLKDFKPINNLSQLNKLLILNAQNNLVDISNLNLIELRLDGTKNVLGIESCLRLEFIEWTDYPNLNFLALKELNYLRTVIINGSKIKNLEGLQNKIHLKYLDLRVCRKLVDIDQINGLAIEELRFNECPKINIDKLENLPNLKSLLMIDSEKMPILKQLKWRFKIQNFRYSYQRSPRIGY